MDYRRLRNELFKRTERYANGVRRLYDQALADIAKEFANMEYDPSRVFSFDEVGKFGRVDAIMTRLEGQIQQVVEKGIVAEFGQAYNSCNELIRQVVGNRMNEEVAKAFMPRVLSGNAAKVFIKANRAGNITASQRVWNGAALGQMETAVEEGLMEGMPANRMAKLLEDYLIDPDSCLRRFRIKTGVDADGKSMYGRKWKKRIIHEDGSTTWKDADPRDYPVGSGVYHSSYRNALRYARTTTNIASRTADYDRYQDLPFVIGIEIKTSGNHPESDICDELAGEYPKDFLWTGWHPNCRCYQVPILAKPDEVEKMTDAIMEGEDPNNVPVEGRITDVPDNFNAWVGKNMERIIDAQRLPYFLRDNGLYWRDIVFVKSQNINLVKTQVETIVQSSFSQEKTIKSLMGYFVTSNPQLFNGGLHNVTITKASDEFMSTVRTYDKHTGKRLAVYGNELKISNVDFTTALFNPFKDLYNAVVSISNGSALSFNQEYAIECLWHEIRHAGAVGWVDFRKRTKLNTLHMEMINQFCARHSYGSFIRALGGKQRHVKEVIANGYGYQLELNNFHTLLEECGISQSEAYRFFNKKIQTAPYEDISGIIVSYISRRAKLPFETAKTLIDFISVPNSNYRWLVKGCLNNG